VTCTCGLRSFDRPLNNDEGGYVRDSESRYSGIALDANGALWTYSVGPLRGDAWYLAPGTVLWDKGPATDETLVPHSSVGEDEGRVENQRVLREWADSLGSMAKTTLTGTRYTPPPRRLPPVG
jgi:hypothetical protein